MTRWLPRNPLQPLALAALLLLIVDILGWIVLRHFGFLVAFRIISSALFLWLYWQRSAFAWHVALITAIVLGLCYDVGWFLHILSPPRIPSVPHKILHPIAGFIVVAYLLCIRKRYVLFERADI